MSTAIYFDRQQPLLVNETLQEIEDLVAGGMRQGLIGQFLLRLTIPDTSRNPGPRKVWVNVNNIDFLMEEPEEVFKK